MLLNPAEIEAIEKYLKDNDYASIEEWGEDSDYRHIPGEGWVDELDYPVALEFSLLAAIEAEAEYEADKI